MFNSRQASEMRPQITHTISFNDYPKKKKGRLVAARKTSVLLVVQVADPRHLPANVGDSCEIIIM